MFNDKFGAGIIDRAMKMMNIQRNLTNSHHIKNVMVTRTVDHHITTIKHQLKVDAQAALNAKM